MSFDIFLQSFRDREVATWSRSLVEEIFGRHIVSGDVAESFFRVTFPDGSGSDIYLGTGRDVDSMMFNHSGGDEFFDALWKLADRVQGLIFWPDIRPVFVITDAATLPHIPADFLAAGAPPSVVKSGAEIVTAIERT